MPDKFSQEPFRCRLDWGFHGVARAARRGDIIVIVDTLSFSTTVTHAVSQGAIVSPCREGDDPRPLAQIVNGAVAVNRSQVVARGTYSLSPFTVDGIPEGTHLVLPSLNGGTCCSLAAGASYVFVAAVINATAAAEAVAGVMQGNGLAATVIACGEREPDGDPPGDLRMAIEDYLGAGAILSALPFSVSPEARVCIDAFKGAESTLPQILWESMSGRELRELGFGADVEFASRLDSHSAVPVLDDGHLRPCARAR